MLKHIQIDQLNFQAQHLLHAQEQLLQAQKHQEETQNLLNEQKLIVQD